MITFQKPNFDGTDSTRLLPKVKHARRIRGCVRAMHGYMQAHVRGVHAHVSTGWFCIDN